MKYKIIGDTKLENGPIRGEVLDEFRGHDYGMKRDHEGLGNEDYINVWRGAYPFFTIPLVAVEEVRG